MCDVKKVHSFIYIDRYYPISLEQTDNITILPYKSSVVYLKILNSLIIFNKLLSIYYLLT